MNASKRWSKGDDNFLRDHAQKQKVGRIAAQAPVVGARESQAKDDASTRTTLMRIKGRRRNLGVALVALRQGRKKKPRRRAALSAAAYTSVPERHAAQNVASGR
jgi:hypothetical protein